MVGLKRERAVRKWQKENKEITRRRIQAQGKDIVCVICGKRYYDHDGYAEVLEHYKLATADKKEQWVNKNEMLRM